jgi:hypothetical protein
MRLGHELFDTRYGFVGNVHDDQARHEFLVRFQVRFSSHGTYPFRDSTASQQR